MTGQETPDLADDAPTPEVAPRGEFTVPAPAFENDASELNNSGTVKLQWYSQAEGRDTAIAEFELQRATDANFTDADAYYRGPDLATYISGLANGDYYYRIREIEHGIAISDWSEPVHVTVEHHSLGLAFTLFGLGGVVFIFTVLVVVRGARRTKDPDAPETNTSQPVEG
ncbi:hypothetical protein GF377_05390 [candidate division GN15 bacterium]|nr:hypothetical protein [candidate division GN15 bacterium]